MKNPGSELAKLRWARIPKEMRVNPNQTIYKGGRPRKYPPCTAKQHRFNKRGMCYYCAYQKP